MKGYVKRDEDGKIIIDNNGFITITCEGKRQQYIVCNNSISYYPTVLFTVLTNACCIDRQIKNNFTLVIIQQVYFCICR